MANKDVYIMKSFTTTAAVVIRSGFRASNSVVEIIDATVAVAQSARVQTGGGTVGHGSPYVLSLFHPSSPLSFF